MQINQLQADGAGSGGPDLQISDAPWTSAAKVAKELRTSTHDGLTELKGSGGGIGGGTEGFDCTAALKELQPTWEARLESVRDECDRLNGALGKAGKSFGEVDHGVKDKVGSVHTPAKPGWAR
ncbi:hypothetical protein [Streptomyces sp. NPDC050485]|uniref:hypothetical protein n=1 Tax=Streptomyces sp. NPDC050485 TaxID=3365617 RepID=UPI0037A068FD